MEVVVRSRDSIRRSYKKIASGYESDIFSMDENEVIKLFKCTDFSQMRIKMAKLEILDGIYVPRTVSAQRIFLDKNGKLIAYSSEAKKPRYKKIKDLHDAGNSKISMLSLEQKIRYYRQAEDIASDLHKEDIFLIDTNLANFIISNDDHVYFLDKDGCRVKNYESEMNTNEYALYYVLKTGDTSLKYVDEFCFVIRLLELIVNRFRERTLLGIIEGQQFCVEEVIDGLDIPTELKYLMFTILSKDGKKEFIGPYLDCIIHPDQLYLRRKNSSLN